MSVVLARVPNLNQAYVNPTIGSSSVTLFEQRDGRLSVSLLKRGDTFDPSSAALEISSQPYSPSPAHSEILEPNAF